MWKSVIKGLILENVESLRHYQLMENRSDSTIEDVYEFVSSVIRGLPWYFDIPIKMIVYFIAIFCFIMTGHKLDLLPPEKRVRFFKIIRYIPFFIMLNKLLRSLVFLRLFDLPPFELECIQVENTCQKI